MQKYKAAPENSPANSKNRSRPSLKIQIHAATEPHTAIQNSRSLTAAAMPPKRITRLTLLKKSNRSDIPAPHSVIASSAATSPLSAAFI